jgi:hypothetical protein
MPALPTTLIPPVNAWITTTICVFKKAWIVTG